MVQQLRVIILIAIGLFCLDNIDHISPPELITEVVTEEAPARNISAELSERKFWLLDESMAYAFHRVTGVPGRQARSIASLVGRESMSYPHTDRLTILGLIVVESNGEPRAVSESGARGLMQIMPATGRFINASFPEEWKGKHMLFDPETNIRYGVWYLNHLQETFPEDEQAALAAYNWGPGNIQRRKAKGQALPRVYPSRVQDARGQIEEYFREYYNTQHWRSLDLDRDPPYFSDNPSESAGDSRP